MTRWIALLAALWLVISAQAAAAQSIVPTPAFTGEGDYFVQAFVTNPTPYVGESILYVLHYYAFALPRGLSEDLPPFAGFWLSDVYELDAPRIETLNNRQYNVGELYAVIIPSQAGSLIIPPASLTIPETVFSPAQTLQTGPVAIEVRSLPEGAPEGFGGAVGQFDLSATIEPRSAVLGDPLRLSVTITGAGNFEQFAAPEPTLPQGWRSFAEPPLYRTSNLGGLRLAEKTFAWLLVPDRTGTHSITPLTFSYFDIEARGYRSLIAPTVTIDIFPGPDGAAMLAGITDSGVIAPMPIRHPLTVRQTDFEFLWWLLWLLPPILAAALVGQDYVRRVARQQAKDRHRAAALARAVQRLKRARSLPSERAFEAVEQIVGHYLAEREQSLDQLTTEQATAVRDLLIRAQEGRYAPPGYTPDPSLLLGRAAQILAEIDRL